MERISIAMTTFNDEKTIIPVLDQLLNQTSLPDEIVVADGGSSDKTVEIIERYAEMYSNVVNIRVISDGKRRNISQGFNDAIKNTHNQWVLVMGTGNSYKTDFIEKMSTSQQSTEAKVLYCTIIGNETTIFAHWFNQYFLRGNKIQDLDISNHGMLIDKSIFEQIGYFWESFVYAGEDFEFSRRVHKYNIKSFWVKEAVAYWDTPQTWQEYKKKMKVNSIADWQIENASKIKLQCITQSLIFLIYLAFSIWKPALFLLLLPVIAVIAYKKHTLSVPAICLGLFNRYLMIWYYAKNKKYADVYYHIPEEYQV